MKASMCNGFRGIGLMDYAYLALNVYHGKHDLKYLGIRPRTVDSLPRFVSDIKEHEGWFQIAFDSIKMAHDFDFYAEFYVKVYEEKIQHLMISFRGTNKFFDYGEDALTWWNTVLPGSEYYSQSVPHYWNYALEFIMKCNTVIKQLDDQGLLADICGQHVTGHSLGGALANLVAAKAAICQPPLMKSHLPVLPDVVSFNAPGIGDMTHISKSAFSEGQVVSMRAEYDMVSALGGAYGYVINNIVPEGYAQAKTAFGLENSMQHSDSIKQLLCDGLAACRAGERVDQVAHAGGVYQQHLMGNFIEMISQHSNALALDFNQLRAWAQQHGGKNHDLNAAPMYSQSGVAAAA